MGRKCARKWETCAKWKKRKITILSKEEFCNAQSAFIPIKTEDGIVNAFKENITPDQKPGWMRVVFLAAVDPPAVPFCYNEGMLFEFTGRIFYWRGPSPYHFVAVPEQASRELKVVSRLVTYGWGVIPVRARIGGTEFQTSLIPKNGGYLVPLKDSVRNAETLEMDADVTIQLQVIF